MPVWGESSPSADEPVKEEHNNSDVEENTFMIWGGEKGSPAFFKGTFSPDGNTCTGAWVFPGGGYSTTMTRVTGA